MKWIKTYDLRLIPKRLLESSQNEQLIPEAFLAMAEFMVSIDQRALFAFIGVCQESNEIKSAITCYFDNTDNCLHLTNMWGVAIRQEPDLVRAIKTAKREYGAVAAKLMKCKVLNLEG